MSLMGPRQFVFVAIFFLKKKKRGKKIYFTTAFKQRPTYDYYMLQNFLASKSSFFFNFKRN